MTAPSAPGPELPAALAPWAAQLGALPLDLALGLAPWLGRLALAIGPLSAAVPRRTGEPDGYHGVSRRGSYERMIATEWGLADEFPEEFLRRAAMGEHLFFELAHREPRAALRCAAILSAGPAQLGSPRLVHLAALIVLARRAAAAGAGFSWGILEDSARRIHGAVDAAAIQHLLDARTAFAAAPDAFAGWLDALGGAPARELWFIGGAGDAAIARAAGAACLVVDDPVEPRRRVVDVEIQRRGAPVRLRLELPESAQCARLLRDPFARASGATTSFRGGRPLGVRFSADGRQLLVELADGSALRWPIPNSPRDRPGTPRRWQPPAGRTVVAIGFAQRAVLAATATAGDPGVIELHHPSHASLRVKLWRNSAAALADMLGRRGALRVGSCGIIRLGRHIGADLVLEIAGHLVVVPGFSLWPPAGEPLTALPFDPVAQGSTVRLLATAFGTASVVWAERGDDGVTRIVRATGRGNRRVGQVGRPHLDRAMFGFATPDREGGWGTIAVQIDDEGWLVSSEGVPPAVIACVAPVLGVCSLDGAPALLIRPQPDRLVWQWRDRREVLPTAATPIAAAAVCTQRPQLAWVTEAGRVNVYSMQHRAILARLYSEAAE
ncbi:MAG TPA: hypothetical protein VHT91_21570 [Kofleriaceae bacterium]|jgi:hypothetical protein|nr:hypothetical protein [Kofleriaceae bacterium]